MFSREEVLRVLRISERQLRSWEKQELVASGDSFAFSDLLALKTLLKLRSERIAPSKIRSALAALRRKVQSVENPLTELRIYSEGSRIRVDIDGQTMEPVSGQLLLNFGATELKKMLAFPGAKRTDSESAARERRRIEAELLFEKGLEMEQTGAPIGDAIAIYEHAITLDPTSTGALVNLGTIYFNARALTKAESYYRQALEADPEYALAHFNLGNLYDEKGDRDQALEHYRQALQLNPQYADAHYNIALLYQTAGESMKAAQHWKLYLKIDPASSWAAIARRELDRIKDATIVRGTR
jgi:tetratricopeptide (TPR) repeat protein